MVFISLFKCNPAAKNLLKNNFTSVFLLHGKPRANLNKNRNKKKKITKTISSINSSLNPKMCVGPNSIPTNILKLLKYEIVSHLSDICNISFSMCIFPSVFKTTKIIPAHKKDSKLDGNNYHSIYFSIYIEKVLEKLVYNRNT